MDVGLVRAPRRAHLGRRRARLRDQLPRARARDAAAARCSPPAATSASGNTATTRSIRCGSKRALAIWSAEFTQAYTPRMTGMDRWIAWDKGDFVGRAAALAERDGPAPAQQLVTLEIDALRRGRLRLRAGLARGPQGRLRHLGRLRPYGAQEPRHGARRAGLRRASEPSFRSTSSARSGGARVIAPSPYDPEGRAMRA